MHINIEKYLVYKSFLLDLTFHIVIYEAYSHFMFIVSYFSYIQFLKIHNNLFSVHLLFKRATLTLGALLFDRYLLFIMLYFYLCRKVKVL